VRIAFDNFLQGFAKWAKHRLTLLGFEVVEVPRIYLSYDHLLAEWCRRNRIDVLVTFDKRDFSKYGNAVVLPNWFPTPRGCGKPKYEKLYTLLLKKLREKGFTPRIGGKEGGCACEHVRHAEPGQQSIPVHEAHLPSSPPGGRWCSCG